MFLSRVHGVEYSRESAVTSPEVCRAVRTSSEGPGVRFAPAHHLARLVCTPVVPEDW